MAQFIYLANSNTKEGNNDLPSSFLINKNPYTNVEGGNF